MNDFFIGKKTVVETISAAINDTSDVLCFDLSNKHICKIYKGTGVMSKLTLYCLSVTVEDLNL